MLKGIQKKTHGIFMQRSKGPDPFLQMLGKFRIFQESFGYLGFFRNIRRRWHPESISKKATLSCWERIKTFEINFWKLLEKKLKVFIFYRKSWKFSSSFFFNFDSFFSKIFSIFIFCLPQASWQFGESGLVS